MEKILSQDEINALFLTMSTKDAALENCASKPAQPEADYSRYDFRRSDRIPKDQTRAIHLLSSDWRVPLSAPSFDETEVQAVAEVMRSGWWTHGPVTSALEAEFAAAIGVPHAIAVSSGTAALHLAFAAMELKPGDEVLTPSLSFVAAANCILHAGGIPRFVDVTALELPLVSPETLEQAITPRTRGICVTHYGGTPCAMDAVMSLARERGLWVVEDAGHAPGAAWGSHSCGAWGDIGCFSFFGDKNPTCGEGGMVTATSDRIASRIRTLRSHGMSSLAWDRYPGHQFLYDVTEPGFDYRMDDLRAAILRVQLSALAELNSRRAERVAWYRELLAGDPRWILPFSHYPEKSAHHLFVIVLSDGLERPQVMRRLEAEGVQCGIHYPPAHLFSGYRKLAVPASDLEVTEALGRRLLSLPLYPDMSREQVEWVAESLDRATL